MPNALTPISDFDGDGIVFRFSGDLSGVQPALVMEFDCAAHRTIVTLNPEDLGNFAGHVESARKALLKLWMAQ